MNMNKQDWLSERVIFGGLIIGGYFGMGAVIVVMSRFGAIPAEILAVTHDVFLTVGPLLGVIVNSIWKADKTDRLVAQTTANLVDKLPPVTPTPDPVPVPVPAPVSEPAGEPDPALAQPEQAAPAPAPTNPFAGAA